MNINHFTFHGPVKLKSKNFNLITRVSLTIFFETENLTYYFKLCFQVHELLQSRHILSVGTE